jgi:hypothetical protein
MTASRIETRLCGDEVRFKKLVIRIKLPGEEFNLTLT